MPICVDCIFTEKQLIELQKKHIELLEKYKTLLEKSSKTQRQCEVEKQIDLTSNVLESFGNEPIALVSPGYKGSDDG